MVHVFDDKLGARNSSQLDEFFTRGRPEKLNVYHTNQSYFGLPRQSIRNNSDKIILSKQTLRAVESMYKNVGGYDMRYDEFKRRCREAWNENFNCLCIDMIKKNWK